MQALKLDDTQSKVIYPFTENHESPELTLDEAALRASMPRDLGNNLVMRFCEAEDVPQAIALFDLVWKRESFRAWFEDLMSGRHPNARFHDFTVVEDRTTHRLVSLFGLISQTWQFGDVSFGCGQPEAIVTHPDYRRHGLVRKQIEIIHQLSRARGERVQVIWGIPWYYRQFGYEYALEGLWDTHRKIRPHHIPDADNPLTTLCRLRPVTPKDYGFIRQLHENSERRNHIHAVKSAGEWRFQFEGWAAKAHARREWRIIECANGSLAGFLSYHNEPGSGGFGVHQMELTEENNYLQFMPGILKALWDLAKKDNQGKAPEEINLYLGQEHPAYQPIMNTTRLIKGEMQCLYVRVEDVVGFLRHISPALEKNLAASPAANFTGKLQITLFKGGFEIDIECGKIMGIDPWKADSFWHTPACPDLSCLQLVFGHRRCLELADMYVDCNVDDVSANVLDALFPSFKGTLWLGN